MASRRRYSRHVVIASVGGVVVGLIVVGGLVATLGVLADNEPVFMVPGLLAVAVGFVIAFISAN